MHRGRVAHFLLLSPASWLLFALHFWLPPFSCFLVLGEELRITEALCPVLLSPAVLAPCFAQVGCLPSLAWRSEAFVATCLSLVSHFRASLVLPVA